MKYFIALLTALGFSLAYAADAKKEEPKKAEPAKAEVKKDEPKKEEKKEGDKPKVKPVGKDGKPADDKKPAEAAKK